MVGGKFIEMYVKVVEGGVDGIMGGGVDDEEDVEFDSSHALAPCGACARV